MMKAARRKLKKLWSRKKKKNKSHNHHHQQYQYNQPSEYHLPPPPNYHYHYTSCCSFDQIQPSAPPLPPNCLEAPPQPCPEGGIIEYSYSFLRQFEIHQPQGSEADDEQEEIIIDNYYTSSPVAVAYSDESQSQQQGIAFYDNDDALLYQKYLVPVPPPPPPVSGVPMIPAPVMEKTQTISGMLLACVVKLGAYLFPCFCPCFHIRQVRCH